ncbi:putative transposase [Klebsiella aerogenes]|uniref:Transposase IS3/IS911 family protein n=1 Tax=Klebsiella aerogenes (strain ATCC 13048 / DSM 30053 / CCUG 1429 / JCM 1235 / KCTC 2190 / NBRC 13534 / NCIMB 10102 / NCTC 10006 / CDC 819-56) TaxID=1028307 RepID=A0A0H3FRK4_KLEAK|nr:transposase IS3/IS911 family protein [Klebsiella aerogenes KCTC 2190]
MKKRFSDATFYTWRKKYGGIEVREVIHLKSLEEENARIKKLLPKPRFIRRHFSWLWGESTEDRPKAGSR